MAELRKITRSSVVSNFQQVAPEAGGTFRVLSEALGTAYENILKPNAVRFMQEKGAEEGAAYARQVVGDPLAGQGQDALSLIKGFEGYRDTPYWDVNAFRVGYGSDTITLPDGTVRRVAQGDKITQADADRDIQRRISGEFEPMVARAIGTEAFGAMSASQRAAITSIAYNYGEVPSRLVPALQSGDADAVAQAIRGLSGDNGGINANRRNKEADVFLSGGASTVVRTSDGKLEPRLFSPASGEILAAHDAAFGVALTSEVMTAGAVDMMSMSQQYALDPNGFRQAAQSYVDKIVEGLPGQFKPDVRASLEKEMTRRFLGVMEDQQADTRKRADNASAALVERWASNLAEAKASGNKEEIDSAQAELGSILMARERLPGVSWTPEQSANVFLDADKQADRIRGDQAKKADDTLKEKLKVIASAAEAGTHGADEAILNDPRAQAIAPDLWEKAVGATFIRDWLPSFKSSTPMQQRDAIAAMRSEPITSQVQLTAIKAAETAAASSAKAWSDDPVAQAASVLDVKPPPLPAFDAASQGAFLAALQARAEYGRKLATDGYTKAPAFLTNAEAETIGALLGKGIDPAIKTVLSGTIVQAFGPDAAAFFKEVKSDDPVTIYAGMMIAGGGNQATASAAMRGQQLLDEGAVQAPSKATSIAAVSPEIASALSVVPNDAKRTGDLLKYATAIYANNAQGIDPASEQASTLMKQAMQSALGQDVDRRGKVTGGVQSVGGNSVLLPVGISGEDVDKAFTAALVPPQPSMMDVLLFRAPDPDIPAQGNSDLWGDKTPMLGGEPITAAMWNKGNLRLVPAGKRGYRIEVVVQGQVRDDVRDQNFNVFFFDLGAMAARVVE